MMQYVLTETEYETLKAAPKLVEDRCYEALLQASRRIANAEIVKEGWYAGRIRALRSWGDVVAGAIGGTT